MRPDGSRLAHRLDDEQVRRFICNGVLVLDSALDPGVHQQIFDKLEWNAEHEFYMGNNVLPRIAELQHILDAPAIHGALQSILGDGYVLSPHRSRHVSEPLDEAERELTLTGSEHGAPMGEGSSGNSAWHQDGHIPMSRARYHVPRMAMILYFPQDTPVERGPTRVIPGTQLQPYLRKSDYPFAFVADDIKAGTCLLIDFDIAHAALTNVTDSTRYMIKFIFLRTRNPVAPSWDGGEAEWQPPKVRLGQFDHSETWSYIWDWMRGAPRFATRNAAGSNEIPRLIGLLNGTDQPARLEAIYELAAIGAETMGPLTESLLENAGHEREFTCPYQLDKYGEYVPIGDPNERRWNDVAYTLQDEAYALGAMGEVAVRPLMELLGHDDAWIKINAAFALGEVGAPAACAVPDLTNLLDHELHQVARAGLDAMGCIGTNIGVAVPAIRRLLTVDNPAWQEGMRAGQRYGEVGVRFNALCALLNSDVDMDEVDDLMVSCLGNVNGYVQALAVEALTRPRTGEDRPGLRQALHYLRAHRWDHTLTGERLL
ncbi:MAG: phytanoyl-CoA dioxygenase family protein [Gammaproteobacteria bacterium]|nr:phytanoyl-CoA dioxygenase family protein [Gammaproteobacteria bacterium]